MEDTGFVLVSQILNTKNFTGFTEDDIRRVVNENEKQRCTLIEAPSGTLRIRANQGHSGTVTERINPDKLLHRLHISDVSPDSICVHGTTVAAWEAIAQDGLSRMNRDMIHCARGLPSDEGVISGMRNSCKVLIYIDIYKAISDNVPFFKSENNVLLTPGVGNTGKLPVAYFKKV